MSSPPVPLAAIRLCDRTGKPPPPAAARRSCIILAFVALIVTAIMLMLPRPAAAAAMPNVEGEAAAQQPVTETASPQPADAVQREPAGTVGVALIREGERLRVLLPFAAPTPAAMFQRGEALWLVFDSAAALDIGARMSQPAPSGARN